jgi:hypothetical protein
VCVSVRESVCGKESERVRGSVLVCESVCETVRVCDRRVCV